MKYLKTYEKIKTTGKLKIGDYVICRDNFAGGELKNFLKNNVGRYIHYTNPEDSENPEYVWNDFCPYLVQYENIPEQLLKIKSAIGFVDNCRGMSREEIIKWSKDKNELDALLDMKKYNL